MGSPVGGAILVKEYYGWMRWGVERSRLMVVWLEEVSTKTHYNASLTIIFTRIF